MKVKFFTFLCILVTASFYGQTRGYAGMRSTQLILKNGDTLNVMGKLKSNVFKYKKDYGAKPVKIKYSEIESIKIKLGKDDVAVFKPLPLKGTDKIIPVEEFVTGNKISLYGVTNNFMGQGAGGIRFQQTSVTYYIKKPSEELLIKLGAYQPIFGNLKEKLKTLFKDCDILLKKIKNKEFRMRDGIEEMFKFYNKKCS
ncbi:MAG: hypothetical protein GKR88_15810 [Flavobacteriaceae bacterium]|nr:MAG: hypothetical protein GKR88_15810 [Flavobacteriaceae bacterium]